MRAPRVTLIAARGADRCHADLASASDARRHRVQVDRRAGCRSLQRPAASRRENRGCEAGAYGFLVSAAVVLDVAAELLLVQHDGVHDLLVLASENDEVFLNTDTMTASLRLEPALKLGHQAVVALDGSRLPGQSPTATSFVIAALTRGTHTLAVAIQDESGQPICSGSVTFHVRQPSVQAPVRSTRPKF